MCSSQSEQSPYWGNVHFSRHLLRSLSEAEAAEGVIFRQHLVTFTLDNGNVKARRRHDSVPKAGPKCFQEVLHFTVVGKSASGKTQNTRRINCYTEQKIFHNIFMVLRYFKRVGYIMWKPLAADSIRTQFKFHLWYLWVRSSQVTLHKASNLPKHLWNRDGQPITKSRLGSLTHKSIFVEQQHQQK